MLKNLDWYQFEMLVGLLYTQEGYRVDRKGGAGADGGVDLVVWRGECDKIRFSCYLNFLFMQCLLSQGFVLFYT